MKPRTTIKSWAMLAGVLAFAIAGGCSDSPPEGSGSGGAGPAGPGVGPGPSSGTQAGSSSTGSGLGGTGANGMGGMGGAPDCFTNPQTHVEIINACTTAEKVD